MGYDLFVRKALDNTSHLPLLICLEPDYIGHTY